jgi:hypothetical protein
MENKLWRVLFILAGREEPHHKPVEYFETAPDEETAKSKASERYNHDRKAPVWDVRVERVYAVKEPPADEKKIFTIPVTYSFDGHFKVKALTRSEAEEIVEKQCGASGLNIHSQDQEIDWEFDSTARRYVQEDTTENRETCEHSYNVPAAPCPFRSEILQDDTPCTCCDVCREQCSADI